MVTIVRRISPLGSRDTFESYINRFGTDYDGNVNTFFSSVNKMKLNIINYMFKIIDNASSKSEDIITLNNLVEGHISNINYLRTQHSNPSKSKIIQDILYLNRVELDNPLSNQENYNLTIKELSKETLFLKNLYQTSGVSEAIKNDIVSNFSKIPSLEKQLSKHLKPSN